MMKATDIKDYGRLPFARARGARIQVNLFGGGWQTLPYPKFDAHPQKYRIDPRDAALQYGHLSKALRDAVLYGAVDAQDTYAAAFLLASNYVPPNFIALSQRELQQFLLFFAEMLADEGL